MARYIEIDKSKIPYNFDIKLSGIIYTITIDYNNFSGDVTATLSLDGEVMLSGRKLILGEPLFEEVFYDNNGNKAEDFYTEVLVPYDLTWQETRVTLDNLGETVFLYVIERD